ncbi:hypothetical protein ACWCXH_16295 [Kitasatospora sp. NPDC001660]
MLDAIEPRAVKHQDIGVLEEQVLAGIEDVVVPVYWELTMQAALIVVDVVEVAGCFAESQVEGEFFGGAGRFGPVAVFEVVHPGPRPHSPAPRPPIRRPDDRSRRPPTAECAFGQPVAR